MPRYEAAIGLEIHAQILTRSKMFCACPASLGAEPNTHVCPICLGHPGALPTVNRQAVLSAVRTSLALGCEVRRESVFSRKSYFYPDLPKGYQISQYDRPLAEGGSLPIDVAGGRRGVRITRLHLEEDAGKNFHSGADDTSGWTAVDFNRAGVPLVEIVTAPDLRSPEEAYAFLRRLRQVLTYLGVCSGRMEEGALRCDANVSVREIGAPELGVKIEVKNLNSFRFVEKALAYEVERQAGVLETGGALRPETRLFDAAEGCTRTLRVKEEAEDYRYFPDPDLPPLVLEESWIQRARESLPELPQAKFERYVEEWGLRASDAEILIDTLDLAEYFEAAAEACHNPLAASRWVLGEVLRVLKERGMEIPAFPIPATDLGELAGMVGAGRLSVAMGKELFAALLERREKPGLLADELGLTQVGDEAEIEAVVAAVLSANPGPLADYRAGKDRAFRFLFGQVMKASGGKANPSVVQRVLEEKLAGGS